jgi:hypothetical protein
MSQNTLTLKLNGVIQLTDFAKSVENFSILVTALTEEIGGNTDVEWNIIQLEAGSALATVQGYASDPQTIWRIVQGFETVAKSLENDLPIPYSDEVADAARKITQVIDSKINSVMFITGSSSAMITTAIVGEPIIKDYTLGTVTGIVDTLSRRRGLKFTLYDILFDRGVICHLAEDNQEIMREAWGRRVTVHGRVQRDPDTGKPLIVRDISHLDIHEEYIPGSYKRARGVLPRQYGDQPAEKIIRRHRDV